jgi:hypothetical protein
MGVGQRLQKDTIDETEDRRIGADPQDEGEDRNTRKSRIFPEHSSCIAESWAKDGSAIGRMVGVSVRGFAIRATTPIRRLAFPD